MRGARGLLLGESLKLQFYVRKVEGPEGGGKTNKKECTKIDLKEGYDEEKKQGKET